jgi:hypothetical protein
VKLLSKYRGATVPYHNITVSRQCFFVHFGDGSGTGEFPLYPLNPVIPLRKSAVTPGGTGFRWHPLPRLFHFECTRMFLGDDDEMGSHLDVVEKRSKCKVYIPILDELASPVHDRPQSFIFQTIIRSSS